MCEDKTGCQRATYPPGFGSLGTDADEGRRSDAARIAPTDLATDSPTPLDSRSRGRPAAVDVMDSERRSGGQRGDWFLARDPKAPDEEATGDARIAESHAPVETRRALGRMSLANCDCEVRTTSDNGVYAGRTRRGRADGARRAAGPWRKRYSRPLSIRRSAAAGPRRPHALRALPARATSGSVGTLPFVDFRRCPGPPRGACRRRRRDRPPPRCRTRRRWPGRGRPGSAPCRTPEHAAGRR